MPRTGVRRSASRDCAGAPQARPRFLLTLWSRSRRSAAAALRQRGLLDELRDLRGGLAVVEQARALRVHGQRLEAHPGVGVVAVRLEHHALDLFALLVDDAGRESGDALQRPLHVEAEV